jgi:aspartyl-tRNA(Asn)/glutamyl-tRNA(Gln) amidotransferase subunit C
MTSRISKENIKKLAALARIEIDDAEQQSLADTMESILGYVDQLQTVSAAQNGAHASAQNTAHTTPSRVYNIMREDTKPHESGIHTAAILEEAPLRRGDYVQVKKILS